MGSFNTTCFASQQTIAPGNACYILPIKQNSGYKAVNLIRGDKPAVGSSIASSTCYADCFWEPFGGFIKAKYDDYGRVEIDFTEENQKKVNNLFEELSEEVFVTLEGENESHDVPFNVADCKEKSIDEAWDYLWEAAVHELRIFLRPYQDNSPRQFTFAIISEQSYDYLLNSEETSKRWDDSSRREDIIDGFNTTLDKRMEDISTRNKCDGKYAKGGDGYEHMRRYISSEVIRRSLERSNVRTPFYITKDIYTFADELVKDGKLSDISRTKMKELMSFGYIMAGLDNLNLKISPMIYASQDYDNSVGKAYAKFIKTVSAQVNKQQKEKYSE